MSPALPDHVPPPRYFLLTLFSDFYEEVARIKLAAASPGELSRLLAAADGSLPEAPHDYAARASARLEAVLRQQEADVCRHANSAEIKAYKLAQYVMAAVADEVLILDLAWPGRTEWLSYLLEYPLFRRDNAGTVFFDLGTTAVTRDYLDRQVARSQVLAGHALPFVGLLQTTGAVNDARQPNDSTAPYWSNTIGELNRYVQLKEQTGQVAQLDKLFLTQLADLNGDDCAKALDYQPAVYVNDLFSARRKRLEEQVRDRCDQTRSARASETYRALADRFNQELSLAYPFKRDAKADADPQAVRAFFADYANRRTAVRQALAGLSGPKWAEARGFLDQLDAVLAFFNGTLLVPGGARPVTLEVSFHALPKRSVLADQVVSWTLTSGTRMAGYPNRPATLAWPYGEALLLDLVWANRSPWLPVRDPADAQPFADGATASFAATGPWALLRLIDTHLPRGDAPASDPLDPNRRLLEFRVPLAGSGQTPAQRSLAVLYLGLKLGGTDPQSGNPVTLKLPAFPNRAPL